MRENVNDPIDELMPPEERRKLLRKLDATQGLPLVMVLFGGKKDVWASNP